MTTQGEEEGQRGQGTRARARVLEGGGGGHSCASRMPPPTAFVPCSYQAHRPPQHTTCQK